MPTTGRLCLNHFYEMFGFLAAIIKLLKTFYCYVNVVVSKSGYL